MIAHMARVEIICMREILNDLVMKLQDEGLLHVEETPLAVDEAPDFLNRVELDKDKQETLDSFEGLERSLHELAPLLVGKASQQAIRNGTAKLLNMGPEGWSEKVGGWGEKLRTLTREKVERRDQIEILENYRRVLELVNPILGAREVIMGKGARVLVLQGDVVRAAEHLQERFLGEVGPECQFITSKMSRRSLVGLITYPENKDDYVGRILTEEGIASIEAPDSELKHLALKEVLGRINGTIGKHREELEVIENALTTYSREISGELAAMQTLVGDELTQLRVVNSFAHSKMVGVINGWIPSDDIENLRSRIEGDFSGKAYVGEIQYDEVDAHRIPTLLKNHHFFKPFEVLLTLFKPPTYGTYDPTVLVAVAFILFYGFILGDVVYGVAVISFAWWLGKKFGHIEAVKSASIVGYYMGVSSIIFGAIYGEYAGNFGANYLGLGALFARGHGDGPSQLLLIAVLVGVVHVPMGLLLGIREDLRHHHTKHAQEKMGLLLGLSAVGIMVCNNFQISIFAAGGAMYVAGLVFIVAVVLIFKGMGAMGLVGVLEIVTLVGNVLSYSRLMALGIASIVLADLANDVGAEMHPLLGIPFALVVHGVNIVIGMASPTIHSLRLNYVEFLPKFYSPEGRKYEPFRKEASW